VPDLVIDVHPGVAMMKKWADELPAKTGRTLEQWAALVRASPLTERKDRIAWLKHEHGLGTNSAWHIADYAADADTWDGDPNVYLRQAAEYVGAMFAGPKAGLRPVFDKVAEEVRKLGPDVRVCPCKTQVPFYRDRVFAQVRPSTRTRLDLEMALGDGVPFGGRLQKNPRAKGNDRQRHMVGLAAAADVDAEVRKWLKAAYKAGG
jgi:predicted transport protein